MSRKLIACLIAAAAVALLLPATVLATGPSAGDQQYIDPLAGSGHSSTPSGSGHSSTPHSSAPSAPASSSTPAATSSSSSSPSSTSTSTSTTGTTTSSTSTAAATSHPLPATGYDALPGALAGFGLLALGTCLRRANRRA